MAEEKADLRKTLATYLAIAFRGLGYWKLGVVIAVVVAIAGTAYAATRKKIWVSSTRIRVVFTQVAENQFLEASAQQEAHEGLEGKIKQFIGTNRFLHEIMVEHDLYANRRARPDMSKEEVIEHMRTKVEWGVYEGDEFSFRFTDHDPRKAQAVCKSLADVFVKQRTVTDTSTLKTKSKLLGEQLRSVEKTLQTKEAYFTRFNEVNAGFIRQIRAEESGGGDTGASSAAATAHLTRIRPTDSPQLRAARLRLKSLQRAANNLSSRGKTAANARIRALQDKRQQVDQSLRHARQRYMNFRRDYPEEYPQLRVAKRQFDTLTRERRSIESSIAVLQASRARPGGQISAAEIQIRAAKAEINRLERLNVLTKGKAIDRPDTPVLDEDGQELTIVAITTKEEVATKLKRLETEIDPYRNRYQDLLQRKLDVDFQLAQQIDGGSQHLTIDPANLPAKPAGPQRTKIALASVVGGIGLGLATMLLFGFVDSHVYRPADLNKLEHLPLLGPVEDFGEDMSDQDGSSSEGVT